MKQNILIKFTIYTLNTKKQKSKCKQQTEQRGKKRNKNLKTKLGENISSLMRLVLTDVRNKDAM